MLYNACNRSVDISAEYQDKLWRLNPSCWNFGYPRLPTTWNNICLIRCFEVAKFITLSPLSLLILIKLSFPTIGIGISSLFVIALKCRNFFVGCVTTLSVARVCRIERWNDKWNMNWKGFGRGLIEVLSRYLAEGTEEDNEKPQSG
jgi:hypothetical protein